MATPFDPPVDPPEFLRSFAGQYVDAERIFTGGQAAVFRATNPARSVHAVKVYFPDPDANIDERTDREVAALHRLHGETLVTLEADGHIDVRGINCRFVATTFIPGRSVATALRVDGPLSVPAVARLGVDTAEAVRLLWTERIVHRDVTPNNVMLAESGRAVLIDLGLARHTALSSLSTPFQGWGTRGYLSPEQAQAVRSLTCKSDIFSLGIVLQQALVGGHPYGRDQRRVSIGGQPTRALCPAVPNEMCEILDAMIRVGASRRPSPSVVIESLQPFCPTGRAW